MKHLLSIFLFFILSNITSAQEQQYVILISFDGFRHDYVQQFDTPHIDELIENGTAAKALIPSFPTKTFPNHYSIVTGLYPVHHGLVDNNFYDPLRNSIYGINDRKKVSDPYYYGGIPLWSYVKKFNLKSASYFWVGSEMNDEERSPNYTKAYDASIANIERIDQTIAWLKLPQDKRPQLICLYFSLIDSNGHRFGPLSAENKLAVEEADSLVGHLMKQLETIELPVNIILTSDHGMKAIENKPENIVLLKDYFPIDNEAFITVNSGTHAQLYFDDKSLIDSVYTVLNTFKDIFEVRRKGEFPANWHYNEANDRIGDLIISAPFGKNLSTKEFVQSGSPVIGAHGYDPKHEDMHTIFFAIGPRIKKGLTLDPFENVDIYPIICSLLNIPIPDLIDGSLNVVGEAIKKP